MDGSQYPTNGINGTSAAQTYPSPTAISPNQLQTGSPLPQTLPPLQPPTAAMQPLYGSHPHTPRTPGTPNTPNSASNVPSYQQTSQPASRPGIYSMAQNPYPPNQAYGTSAPMMPQTTTAASHPQPIAPAPVGGRGPPVLRPMPPGGIMAQPGVSSPYGPGAMQPNPVMQDGSDQPTHVVGSQGRRGILPSAPGRPAAPAAGAGAKSTVIPVKDADGKFPCPHCTKTYLHAKHLKRHLLRHTGDRPYMCVLCRDTFSRSDILKRHFQKCSIRRGNPTGASHLSHPQAHVKKNAQKAAALGNEGDMNHLNGLNNMPADGMVHPFGMVQVNDGMNNMGDQNHLSRSSSMGRMDNGTPQDRSNMAPSMGAPQPYGANVSNSMSQQQMPSYSMPPGQNGMPMYGGSNGNQQSGLDWSQMFQAGAHQPLNNNSFPPPNRGQTQIATKTGPNDNSGPTDSSSSDSVRYSLWGIPRNIPNPYTQLSNQILNFLYPPNEAIDPILTGMNLYFSPDNTKDFIDQYSHFHKHVPILHPATFRAMEAHPALTAGMCCIGACYSQRVVLSDVQEMMDALWSAMQRDCDVLAEQSLPDAAVAEVTNSSIEELQSVLLGSILLVCNGTAQQRGRALRSLPMIAAKVRRLGLLGLSGDPSVYSMLHHPIPGGHVLRLDDFEWVPWVGQESRIRLMYALLALDSLCELLFNISPQFDPSEAHLPLPCDHSSWDAPTAAACAAALGLMGIDAAKAINPYGSRHPSQPELHIVRNVLLNNNFEMKKGCTNTLGKVLLCIAMIATVRLSQKLGSANKLDMTDEIPSLDWIVPYSGHNQPLDKMPESASDDLASSRLFLALDKLHRLLHEDALSQESDQCINEKLSCNGVKMFQIAQYILAHPEFENEGAKDCQDQLADMWRMLNSICRRSSGDKINHGDELGNAQEVEVYGRKDLILDLARIFGPVSQELDEPGPA